MVGGNARGWFQYHIYAKWQHADDRGDWQRWWMHNFSGGTGQPQGADGAGGCTPITTQVGGTNYTSQQPLLPNFVCRTKCNRSLILAQTRF